MKRKILVATTAAALVAWIGCTHSERKAEESAEYKEQPVAERGVAASNGEFSFPSGTYGKHHWYGREDRTAGDRLIFEYDRGVVKVNDIKNQIIYSLDTNNQNEQELNPKVIEKIRNTSGARALGGIIKSITVSNIHIPRDGQLDGTFNIYLVNSTPFGELSATIRVGASVRRESCFTMKNMPYNGSSYKGPRQYQSTCLRTETATHVEVAAFRTTLKLSSAIINGLGLITDTILKITSPGLGRGELFYQYQ